MLVQRTVLIFFNGIKTNIFDDVFLSASLPLRRVPDGHEEGENKAQQLGLWKERRGSS
jgi:hypothetical protein